MFLDEDHQAVPLVGRSVAFPRESRVVLADIARNLLDVLFRVDGDVRAVEHIIAERQGGRPRGELHPVSGHPFSYPVVLSRLLPRVLDYH